MIGRASHLKVIGRTLDADTVEAMKLPANTKGTLVIAAAAAGPAEKAGLQGSDDTFELAGVEVELGGDVIRY